MEGIVRIPTKRVFLGTAALVLFACGQSIAADLLVNVRDSDGAPVENAVVTITLSGNQPAQKIDRDTLHQVNQKDTAYHPFVSIVPQGAPVAFINSDSWGHHVYSFSKPKRFDITVPSNTTSDPIVFDKPGVVTIGCNIHDRMLAYIYVNGDGIPVKSDKTGAARFLDLEPGAYVATVWHPALKS
ncbi:MAG: hypothetical protein OXT01_25005, partial [Rhodospirillaceae bacterium]|nr:hypothetical protein [Rhodospirillaceae bacterium]